MNCNFAMLDGEQLTLAQLAQNAVDVNRAQAQCVGENILAERAFEFGFRRQAHEVQPLCQLHEKVGRAFSRIPPSNTDKVLDNHGFIAGRSPQDCRSKTWEFPEGFHHARGIHRGDHGIRERFE
jgi:hypothetical protein